MLSDTKVSGSKVYAFWGQPCKLDTVVNAPFYSVIHFRVEFTSMCTGPSYKAMLKHALDLFPSSPESYNTMQCSKKTFLQVWGT